MVIWKVFGNLLIVWNVAAYWRRVDYEALSWVSGAPLVMKRLVDHQDPGISSDFREYLKSDGSSKHWRRFRQSLQPNSLSYYVWYVLDQRVACWLYRSSPPPNTTLFTQIFNRLGWTPAFRKKGARFNLFANRMCHADRDVPWFALNTSWAGMNDKCSAKGYFTVFGFAFGWRFSSWTSTRSYQVEGFIASYGSPHGVLPMMKPQMGLAIPTMTFPVSLGYYFVSDAGVWVQLFLRKIPVIPSFTRWARNTCIVVAGNPPWRYFNDTCVCQQLGQFGPLVDCYDQFAPNWMVWYQGVQ